MDKYRFIEYVSRISSVIIVILIIIGVGFKSMIPSKFHQEFGIIVMVFVITGLVTFIILKLRK
jgi:hypothetical protein